MVVHLSPEQEAQLLADYHAKQAERLKKEREHQAWVQSQKSEREAFWMQKRASLPVGKPQTDQTCGDCGTTIPAHTQAKYAKREAVYGSNKGLKRVYLCNKCVPITEAQQA